LDYLLKPFDLDRFSKTLDHAKAHISRQRGSYLNEGILNLLEELKKPKTLNGLSSECGRVSFLKTDEIDWIEAEGNYVRLHVGKESHLLRETLNQMEGRLDPEHSSEFIAPRL